jgi:hypothetical protein
LLEAMVSKDKEGKKLMGGVEGNAEEEKVE